MGISASPAIWQQFVNHIIQELQFPDDYQIIMDDTLIFTPINSHFRMPYKTYSEYYINLA